MFKRINQHRARKQLRSDAKKFSSLIETYGLDLSLRNSLGDIARLRSTDDFKHVLTHRNHLDGSVAGILKKLVDSAKEPLGDCIDVGANCGYASVYLAKHCRRVFAFEPEEKNIARFRENIQENLLKNVEVLPIALSNYEGRAKFYVSSASTHHSLGLAHKVLNKDNFVEVEVQTLDGFCSKQGITDISIFKLDTEGFELEVLQGASRMLGEKRIKHLIFEISQGPLQRLGRDCGDLIALLKKFEYRVSAPDGTLLPWDKIADSGYQDFLATP